MAPFWIRYRLALIKRRAQILDQGYRVSPQTWHLLKLLTAWEIEQRDLQRRLSR